MQVSRIAKREALVVASGFCQKILEGGRGLRMVLCHSMNAGWVVRILVGGGDNQTLPAVIDIFFNFSALWAGGDEKKHLPGAHVPVRAATRHRVKHLICNVYHLQTKFGEGNVFTHICLSGGRESDIKCIVG